MTQGTGCLSSIYRVVIADDDTNVRQALGELIDDFDGLSLVGQADNGLTAAELCQQEVPDLAVVDVMMPCGGVEAVEAIHARSPSTMVVAYTARTDRRTRVRLLDAGASAVFAKGGARDLASSLFELLNGCRRTSTDTSTA